MNSPSVPSPADGEEALSGPIRPLSSDLFVNGLEGAAFGGMVGLGETYLAAFALAVGLGELTAGMVSSLPLVAGGLMQTVSPWAVRRLKSHKRWVVLCALVQALTFFPLALAAWRGRGSINAFGILALATLYWGSGLAGGPAWNTWIGAVVPPAVRARHFAMRTRWQQAAVCCGVLGGGVLLHWAGERGQAMTAFMAMFVMAGTCRLTSVKFLTLLSEPTPIPANMRRIAWSQVLEHLRASSGGRLLVYLAAMQASVQMAGPYFTPFMFEKLGMSYGDYVAVLFVSYLTKAIALPIWGRVVRDIGTWRLLWIGGIGITPLSAGWVVSDHIAWLVTLQIAGGVMWAAYELAFFLLFFESIAPEERTSLLTIYNVIHTVAWVGGAMLGGLLLHTYAMSYIGYLWVFAGSSAGRALSLFLLVGTPTLEVAADAIGVRSVAVRPNEAALDAVVLPSLPDQTGASDSSTGAAL